LAGHIPAYLDGAPRCSNRWGLRRRCSPLWSSPLLTSSPCSGLVDRDRVRAAAVLEAFADKLASSLVPVYAVLPAETLDGPPPVTSIRVRRCRPRRALLTPAFCRRAAARLPGCEQVGAVPAKSCAPSLNGPVRCLLAYTLPGRCCWPTILPTSSSRTLPPVERPPFGPRGDPTGRRARSPREITVFEQLNSIAHVLPRQRPSFCLCASMGRLAATRRGRVHLCPRALAGGSNPAGRPNWPVSSPTPLFRWSFMAY